ncbi:hypothetical protein LRS73_27680 [Methylobacterium currus]|uniref:hypothetical protein n=1 Tax=Methylobacterium currus TaxID=2051553 RepID=UPI0013DF39C4|nr:hypothetical protein [Methylobacterium currus]UHC16207.1 hypothetical protein LRS73_27680 [Methylobacterium currus]
MAAKGTSYQDRSAGWMDIPFDDPTDGPERRDRAAEDVCEGYQADGGTLDDWIAIGRYTFGRPAGLLPKVHSAPAGRRRATRISWWRDVGGRPAP